MSQGMGRLRRGKERMGDDCSVKLECVIYCLEFTGLSGPRSRVPQNNDIRITNHLSCLEYSDNENV